MKKLITFAVSLLALLSLALPCSAMIDSPYMIDEADLLNDYEEEYLLTEIENLISKHGYDIIIHTTLDTYGQDIVSYCDDYYDNGDYAEDGLIFVISMAERDYYTSTCGTLVDSLTSYELEMICNSVVPYLSDGNYYSAFEEYLRRLDSFLSGNEDIYAPPDIHYGDDSYGDEYYYDGYYDGYDTSYQPSTPNYFVREIVVVVVAAIIAFVITSIIKSKMNTAVKQHDADNYVTQGSFILSGQRDAFIGSHTTRRAIPKNNTNHGGRIGGGGGGGGHISSGGVRHGGGGGKF